jgi:hypothetical protein
MSEEQIKMLRQLMQVVDIKQIRYGIVREGVTDHNLCVTYTVPGLQGTESWFDETISVRGHVIARTIVPG